MIKSSSQIYCCHGRVAQSNLTTTIDFTLEREREIESERERDRERAIERQIQRDRYLYIKQEIQRETDTARKREMERAVCLLRAAPRGHRPYLIPAPYTLHSTLYSLHPTP